VNPLAILIILLIALALIYFTSDIQKIGSNITSVLNSITNATSTGTPQSIPRQDSNRSDQP